MPKPWNPLLRRPSHRRTTSETHSVGTPTANTSQAAAAPPLQTGPAGTGGGSSPASRRREVSFSIPAVARRPRASLPNAPYGVTDSFVCETASAASEGGPHDLEVGSRDTKGGCINTCDQLQLQRTSAAPFERVARISWSRDEADRRGLYGVAAPPFGRLGERWEAETQIGDRVTEPIYEVIGAVSDADCFSPAVIPWDDAEETPTSSPPAPVSGATLPSTPRELIPPTPPHTPRNSNESVAHAATDTSTTGGASCVVNPPPPPTGTDGADGSTARTCAPPPTNAPDPKLRRQSSSVELSTISSTTGESKRWESVQRVKVRRLSLEEAEAILLRLEHGPGTFLFRECNDQVVLTLWDGTSVHHYVIRDRETAVLPADFYEGRRFRDFIRGFRGGASGVLPSALRHMVIVDSEEPAPRKESSFTLHSLYTTTPILPPSAPAAPTPVQAPTSAPPPSKIISVPRARGRSVSGPGLMSPVKLRHEVYSYDRVLDHTTATHL